MKITGLPADQVREVKGEWVGIVISHVGNRCGTRTATSMRSVQDIMRPWQPPERFFDLPSELRTHALPAAPRASYVVALLIPNVA